MARLLAEASDDELPELDDVFNAHRARREQIGSELRNMRDMASNKALGPGVPTSPDCLKPKAKQKLSPKAAGTKAKRKVVLAKRQDNPLLRPIQNTKTKDLNVQIAAPTAPERTEPSLRASAADARMFAPVPKQRLYARSRPKYDEVTSDSETSGISDFVVDTIDVSSSEEGENFSFHSSPPYSKPTRRLVRGRRPQHQSSENIDKENCSKGDDSLALVNRALTRTPDSERTMASVETSIADLRLSPVDEGSDHKSKTTRFITPPSSPSKSKSTLVSPSKRLNRIPLTPHRPSIDAFWSQDVINEWNDEFSPQKALKVSRPKSTLDLIDTSDATASPRKSPAKRDKKVIEARKAFALSKHELATSFLHELDEKITSGQVLKLTESTGGVTIIWSKTLQTTAGRANWRREARYSARNVNSEGPPKPIYRHFASIELAEKVIDDEDRLLNVIAHEFCHLANFMISGIKNNPHGKEFQAWGAKCTEIFAHRGVEVTTKHSYAIDYKYIWICTECAREFKRHSKSIDPARHTCGVCKSKLIQTKPVPRATSKTAPAPNEYQQFVKKHMKTIREENPGSPQKVIMSLVGKKYQAEKALKTNNAPPTASGGKTIDEVDLVIRKLNFIDLSDPSS